MPVNMVVRKTAMDGFVAPAVYGLIFALLNLFLFYSTVRGAVVFLLSSPVGMCVGLVLSALFCWGMVKAGKAITRSWRHRDVPVIDMDDEWMTYRSGRDFAQRRVFYKDMFRTYLQRRAEEEPTQLVIELFSIGYFRSQPEPIEIDLADTNAQPEDVCDAIAERIVRQNPAHGQGTPLPSGW